MKYDYLIVGAGLYGAVFAHEAKKAGKSVLVIDKRTNIAGNVYTEAVEGIQVHKYGAHIFHGGVYRLYVNMEYPCGGAFPSHTGTGRDTGDLVFRGDAGSRLSQGTGGSNLRGMRQKSKRTALERERQNGICTSSCSYRIQPSGWLQ